MPKLVRTKPDTARLPEDHLIEQAERVFAEQASVELETEPNDVRSELETDRTGFGSSTESTEQRSTYYPEGMGDDPPNEPVPATLPRGEKAVLKAPVDPENRRPFDDYPTEPGWTKALLERVDFEGTILEPAAGAGWMVQTLQEAGHRVKFFDLERDGKDFLKYQGPDVENVVTNPPYKLLDEFAAKALEVATHKVALLLPDFALVGVNRTKDLWLAHPPAKLILVASKMKVLGKVSMFPHLWVVWDKNHAGPTEWEWAVVPREERLDTSKSEPNTKRSAK